MYIMPDASTQTDKPKRGPKLENNNETKIKKAYTKNKLNIKKYDKNDIKTIIMFDDV